MLDVREKPKTPETFINGFFVLEHALLMSSTETKVRGYALAPDTKPDIYGNLALDEVCESVLADIRDQDPLTRALSEFRPEIVILADFDAGPSHAGLDAR